MEQKRYLIEIGTGVDMHGGSMTKAALKAIRDAISHCCMAGIREILGAGPERIALRITVCCPDPGALDLAALREPVNFYDDVEIIPAPGGAEERGLHVAEMGGGDTLTVAVAVITVFIKC